MSSRLPGPTRAIIRSRSIRALASETLLRLLASLGFNRLSLGVQDFDAAVQRAVNRVQSADHGASYDAARASGFRSINFDLIYGLPKQTP